MNRDEQMRRVAANPPEVVRVGSRAVIRPSEPRGGTWIAANDGGVTVALINWYALQRARVSVQGVSRGEVVRSVLSVSSSGEVEERLGRIGLGAIQPFRLLAVVPAERVVVEWRWDRVRLARRDHGWESGLWASSGYDEPGAQRTRAAVFELARLDADTGTSAWLRRLHAGHEPGKGPFSICMHRDDAATVSYTEVEVNAGAVTLRYAAGALCEVRPEAMGVWSVPRHVGEFPRA